MQTCASRVHAATGSCAGRERGALISSSTSGGTLRTPALRRRRSSSSATGRGSARSAAALGGATATAAARPSAMWTRPTPDRNEDWIKPSYVPRPQQAPVIAPREEPRPLYTPSAPEFRPAEMPDKQGEMPEGPKMPERRPDPIPAGNPKERPSEGGGKEETREAPPPAPDKK